jgi:hypothetical protein
MRSQESPILPKLWGKDDSRRNWKLIEMVLNEPRLGGTFFSCNAILVLLFVKSKTWNPVAAREEDGG